ncbi:MAG: hypothetical protein EBR82_64635 [Caulobacteraceae bacterium]|nr:hypothetical protein [Caulobacteraceae bacterium]
MKMDIAILSAGRSVPLLVAWLFMMAVSIGLVNASLARDPKEAGHMLCVRLFWQFIRMVTAFGESKTYPPPAKFHPWPVLSPTPTHNR